jgi:hypothetical protein
VSEKGCTSRGSLSLTISAPDTIRLAWVTAGVLSGLSYGHGMTRAKYSHVSPTMALASTLDSAECRQVSLCGTCQGDGLLYGRFIRSSSWR